MYQCNYFRILIFTFLIPRAYSEILFNSLSEKLVLNLVKVTPKQNVVASEYLVRLSLCKLASVATGEAKRELMFLLGYRDDAALSQCYKNIAQYITMMKMMDLTVTNRIYVNYTKDIDPKFYQNSSENDGVQVEKVGFNYPKAAIAHINNLLSAMTFRRITDMVDSNDINKNTKMIIVSGAHFKGTWDTPFDYKLTKLARFTHINGTISRIPMMFKMDEFLYKNGGNCEVVSIRFLNSRSSLTFVVPNTLKDFESILEKIYNQKGFVSSLTKGSERRLMKLTIPRFKIKTFVDWTGFLQGLGLNSVFNTNSLDLAGMFKTKSQNQTISLSKVKQKVFVQFDEMGVGRKIPDPFFDTEPTPMPYYNVPALIVDRPFYFEVAWDLEHGRYELFAGVYYGPESDLSSF